MGSDLTRVARSQDQRDRRVIMRTATLIFGGLSFAGGLVLLALGTSGTAPYLSVILGVVAGGLALSSTR